MVASCPWLSPPLDLSPAFPGSAVPRHKATPARSHRGCAGPAQSPFQLPGKALAAAPAGGSWLSSAPRANMGQSPPKLSARVSGDTATQL